MEEQKNQAAAAAGTPPGAHPDTEAVEPSRDELVAQAAQRITELEGEIGKLKDQLLRALAETENVRRRAEREKEDAGKFAVASFARDLLSVADNLKRAVDSAPEDAAVKALVEGVEATERELLQVFERRGMKRIDAAGERFDPNLHQAMFEVPDSGQPAGTVVQVLQPGWTLHDRLLRPAMVGVAKASPGGDSEPVQRVDTKA